MKLKTIQGAVTGLALAATLPASAQDCGDITGDWINNLGATMRIDTVDTASGLITGGYYPASAPDRRFPMTGFVNANGKDDSKAHYAVPVSLTVSFGEFGGITNWSGTCRTDTGEPRIETEDLIIMPMADYDWSHVIDNHDTLVRKK